MNILFVVIWTISTWVYDPCPNSLIDNPYTGQSIAYSCLVNHGHYEEKEMRKEFYTKQEAEAFIENAPEEIKPRMKIKDK